MRIRYYRNCNRILVHQRTFIKICRFKRKQTRLSEEIFFDIPLFSLCYMDKNQNRIKSVIFIVESFGRKSSKQPRPRIISTITFEINVA